MLVPIIQYFIVILLLVKDIYFLEPTVKKKREYRVGIKRSCSVLSTAEKSGHEFKNLNKDNLTLGFYFINLVLAAYLVFQDF